MTALLRPSPPLPDVADWNRLLAASGRPIPLAGGATAVFEPASPPDPSLPRVGVVCGPLALLVVFTRFPFDAMFGTALAAADVGDLGGPLRDALIEGMLGTVAAAMPEPWRLSGPNVGPTVEPNDAVWFDVVVERLAPQPIRLAVCGSRARIAAVLGRLAPDSPVRRGLVASVRVRLSADLVRLSVPRPALARLPGRLLLLPRSAADRVGLVIGDRVVEVAADAEGWRCRHVGPVDAIPLDPFGTGTSVMHDPIDAPADAAAPVLHLPVDFSIGGVEATLGEIDGWRPGTILPIDLPMPREGLAVTIRVAGATVGSGDLVAIEDRFAVRITTLGPV